MFLLNEIAGVVSVQLPYNYVIGSSNGDAVDMSKFDRVMFILDVGTLSSGATVDYKIVASLTSGGTYAALSGKAITQITACPTGKVAIIEVSAAEVHAASKRYVKDALVIAGSSAYANAVGVAYRPRYGPMEDADLAAVVEIV